MRDAVRFDIRPYQLAAADAVIRLVRRHRNAIVGLPTGAGKTNVALIATAALALKKPAEPIKVLYVVPTRILVQQVAHAARWLDPELYRVAVTPRLAANRFSLQAALHRSTLIVTTPGMFASLLRSGSVDRSELCAAVPCVVVDEFDEFLTIDPTYAGSAARYEDDLAAFLHEIGPKPLVLMSGTAPKIATGVVHSYRADLFARFIESALRPVNVEIPERQYRKHIPLARVRLVPVADDFVFRCDAALKRLLQKTLEEYECKSQLQLDRDYLMERLSAIASGFLRKVRLTGGRMINVSPEIRALCATLQDIVGKYTHLFEDMFAGLSPATARVPLVLSCVETDRWVEVVVLQDNRRNKEFWPLLRGKADQLLEIVRLRAEQRGVIFSRNVRLSDALIRYLIKHEIGVVQIDGRQSEAQRFANLRRFSESAMGVLLITRSTGKRGLDIPAADFALLYSPKEDEYTVWQELSRIRSTLGQGKDTYIMYYAGTSEERKLMQLVTDMRASANRYEFVGTTRESMLNRHETRRAGFE